MQKTQKKLTSPGFTLIELLLVITVIALVAAVSLPRLGGASNQRTLDMAAQNLASDIRLVQQININSGGLVGKESKLLFYSDSNGYFYSITIGGSLLKKVYLPKIITISAKNIQFSVTGAPVAISGTNSAQTISLKNSDGKILYIKIAPITGRVRITDVASTDSE